MASDRNNMGRPELPLPNKMVEKQRFFGLIDKVEKQNWNMD